MKRRFPAAVILLAVIVLLIDPPVVWAAEANAHFGSISYTHSTGEVFNLGVYMDSAEAFTEYSIILSYDPARVEYVSGAISGGEGTVVLGGVFEGGTDFVKTMLQFRALVAGDTSFVIAEATAVDAEGNAFDIVSQGAAPLSIRDNTPVYLDGINIGGQPLEGFDPETFTYELQVPYETEALEVEALGYEAEISETALEVGENTIDIRLTSPGGTQTIYDLHVTREEKIAETEETASEGLTGEAEGLTGGVEGAGAESQTGEGQTTDAAQAEGEAQTGEILAAETEYEALGMRSLLTGMLKQRDVYITVIFIVLAAVGIAVFQTYREYSEESAGNKEEIGRGETFGWKDPIIAVEDVCMDFKVAMQSVSGVKEWMIKKLGGKISYRTLHALSHISFFVYPGEVIGIIGTNGSGKSTLLKIISGALTPTSGFVKVDRSKIQLLTLGTGFDMELTARENVYLNGSVIGYSREFIDEHYNDIVEFAELEGFMEEKVKNFSSGMVSRLGFAIATAGDAAEILILDEVLSVGDEFFRKKSLARIKEMIHGGSTVLMVSHGMGTIMENCNRAVWIEKGKLMMMGDVKRVCEAYQRMKG
ncbi:MAG: ATP-binding cassette domain-containing protein [Lachnospiraceae bacterium]|nr:ATP-binding cassette domain-containing protein [Lachnospiraceae bacterium]